MLSGLERGLLSKETSADTTILRMNHLTHLVKFYEENTLKNLFFPM